MKINRMPPKANKGFTLIEMLIAVTIFGMLSVAADSAFQMFMTAKDRAYVERQTYVNNKIAAAMLDYAENPPAGVTAASLPAPYTYVAGKIYFGPIDTSGAATSLYPYVQSQGISKAEALDDTTNNARVRVYQKTATNSVDVGLFSQGGPAVTITYDLGVIYMTACSRTLSCNSPAYTPTTQTTPTPTKLSPTNFTTWTPPSDAVGTTWVTTWALQRKMATATAQRIDLLRTLFLNFYNTKGYFPYPLAGRSMTNGLPTNNQGCREGWYDLSRGDTASMDILNQVGLGQVEDGRTAWGASIEYCQDYDPTGMRGFNTPPYYAALRINKQLSQNLAPDSATWTNNVVIGF